MVKHYSNKILSLLLAVIIIVSLVTTAFAASGKQTTTELFVDSDGETIAEPVTSTTDAKDAPAIDGYVYKSQSTETTHVYAEQHITYIIGYPDGGVKAENNMTRAEAVVVLYRLYNGNYPSFTKRMSNDTYADVDSTAWYYKELECLYNVGVVTDAGKFRPNEPITRAEFATLCARYDGLKFSDKEKFSDVETGYWAYSYINAAAEKGWIVGYPDGTFKPDNSITRAEIMTLVNRLFNRAPTVEQIEDVKNPYNDIVSTHWAYCDVIEATVKHDTVDWHGAKYNDGKYNIVIEKFVDADGKEIAEAVTTESKANYHPAEIRGYSYLGYITEITYTYEPGKPIPALTKSASVTEAKVGDTVTYTVTASNGKEATDAWRNVVITDEIPAYMNFVHGSVYLNGKHTEYSFADGVLSVPAGDVASGKSATVSFNAKITGDAYGKVIYNTAVGTGSNSDDVTAKDSGVTVADGTVFPSATKAVSATSAKVGDRLIYTITAANDRDATVSWKNATMTDELSSYLTFTHGSVQVDGKTAAYSYSGGVLTVPIGDIAPGSAKTVTFEAVVNSTAYNTTIRNTAIMTGDNTSDPVEASDGGVTIFDGTPEGSAGAKTVSSPTAKVGDTLTYTISLRNASTATAAWTGVKITDVIPEYLSFISGSVEENGRSTTNFAYNAGTKTLTLFADSIAVGDTITFTFKVTVQDGAQGMYIVNTAVVSGDGREDIQLPDTGVQIDSGETAPYISKSASVSQARPGDIYRYTVTIKNGMSATAAWKNVIMSDVLPTGVKLVSGSVTLNRQTVSYGIAGQAIEVTVGDLKADEDAIVTFEVRVLDSAAGTTVHNVAVAKGNNGEKSATDDGVTVPQPDGTEDTENTVTGTKTVDKTLVNTGDKVKYTITAVNNSDEPWTAVQIYDVLDTSVLTLIDDSIYIDGIRFLGGSGKCTFTDRQLVVNLGDIAPGQSVKLDFTVQFKNDAANSTYTNNATIKSASHESVYVKSPEVVIIGGGNADTPDSYTEIHYKLFIGSDDGEWKPTANMRLDHMCLLAYRLMTDYYRSTLGNGAVPVPDEITDREIQYFMSHGIISASEFEAGAAATQSQIYRLLNYAVGGGLSSNSSVTMSRASVAALVCDLTGRDTTPGTNGLYTAYFPDKGSYAGLIDEVSNSHDYTKDSNGNETWISILND